MGIVSIANQKGGVGKTTLTIILSTYLQNEKNLKVAVLDADYQKSISNLRQEEMEEVNPFPENTTDIYPVDSVDVVDTVKELMGEYDHIFIDLPGNLKQPGVIKSLSQCSHIVIPFQPDIGLEPSVQFYRLIKDNFNSKIKGVLTDINPRTLRVKELLNVSDKFIIPLFKHYIPSSDKFKDLSTLDTFFYKKDDIQYLNFIKEFELFIND